MLVPHQWHPIAAADDLPFRHVYHGQLLGREFAVWRADDGYVNVWENRCLHRGVRLSIGINDGRELKCQYHGWRYSNRTAGCTYIPAHPADAPARTITNRTYPAVERYGLVWTAEQPEGEVPTVAGARRPPAIRAARHPGQCAGRARGRAARPVSLPAERRNCRQRRDGHGRGRGALLDRPEQPRAVMPRRLPCSLSSPSMPAARSFAASSIASRRPATALPSFAITTSVCRRCATWSNGEASAEPAPAPIEPVYERVSAELAAMPELQAHGRKAGAARRGRPQMAGGAGHRRLRAEAGRGTAADLPARRPYRRAPAERPDPPVFDHQWPGRERQLCHRRQARAGFEGRLDLHA